MSGPEPGRPARLASVAGHVEPLALEEPAVGVWFLGEQAVFVGGDAACTLIARGGAPRRIAVTDGAILSTATDGARLVMGCDDGRVIALDADGAVTTLATDPKRRWVDCVAVHSDGTLAWSAGRTAFVRGHGGAEKSWDAPSTVGGLAFAPKGLRLAIAHYGGATLWFPNMAAKPERLDWAGSHLGVLFSPDNRFLVTAMHEPALHGWRLADGRHMRMSGYPARVKSMAWCGGGKLLATSGADAVILWPFGSKDGPMGKQPMMLAALDTRVACVAAHPSQDILAVGYEDGTVLLVRLPDGAEVLARERDGDAVAALGWSASGELLAFAIEGGAAGLLTVV